MSALRRLRRDERGLGLLEMVIAVAILSIAAPIVGMVMITSLRTTDELATSSQVLDELRLQVSAISRELRSAICITAPAENGSGSVLTFTTESNAADSTTPVSYEVVGGELVRTQGSDESRFGRGIVGPAAPFRQVTTPRRSVEIDFSVRLKDDDPAQDIGTVVAGRNAWRTCT